MTAPLQHVLEAAGSEPDSARTDADQVPAWGEISGRVGSRRSRIVAEQAVR